MIKALKEGAEYGKTQHMKNAQKSSYLWRYGESSSRFWNNFFQNTLKFKSTSYTVMSRDNGCYIDKESGAESLTKNWNSFVSKWTNDNRVKLNAGFFLAYA